MLLQENRFKNREYINLNDSLTLTNIGDRIVVDNWPFEGVINSTRRRYKETRSEGMRQYYSQYLSQQPCPTCKGSRFARAATISNGRPQCSYPYRC